MADAPSKALLESIKASGIHKPRYMDVYPLTESRVNPLSQVVPCIKGSGEELKDQKPFFGPFVLNIVCITGPYIRSDDDGGGWEDDDVAAQTAIIKATYSQFSRYETHYLIDADADAAAAEDNEEAMQETEDLLDGLCEELAEYGFTFHGRLDAGEVDTKIRQIIDDFKEACKAFN